MVYTKRIVCLANSRKPPSGRRVAGREVNQAGEFGLWIRPVSARSTREVSEEERRYQNGQDIAILDVVTVSLMDALPEAFQTENHVIDDRYYWERAGRLSWNDTQAAVEAPNGPLSQNGSSSSRGENDRVPENDVNVMSSSLLLVRPEKLELSVEPETSDYAPTRRRVRAIFDLEGYRYKTSVTDPVIERT